MYVHVHVALKGRGTNGVMKFGARGTPPLPPNGSLACRNKNNNDERELVIKD